MTRDGRVSFGKNGLPHYSGAKLETTGLRAYTEKRRVTMKGGGERRVDAQKAVIWVNKPGPKPTHGITLDARLRKIKQRCREKGLPFVLAEHVKEKEST
jgi:hypothetical protein